MVDVFFEKICSICKNNKSCNNCIVISEKPTESLKKIYCANYIKDDSKIVPYKQPLIVTALKKHIKYTEK